MIINDITSPANVWGAAARTLTADPATDAGAATLVWTHAARTPTGIGGAQVIVTTNEQTLAASATLDLRPAASKVREMIVGVKSGAAGTAFIEIFDGAQAYSVTSVAQGGASITANTYGTTTTGVRLRNGDAANAMKYLYSGMDWTQ